MDLTDELIDRYGDPPKAIQGLITVALVRNMAGESGITEISQKNSCLLFYMKCGTIEQIQAVVAAYRGRVTVNSSEKPYISVKLTPKDKAVDVMESVVRILYDNRGKTNENDGQSKE